MPFIEVGDDVQRARGPDAATAAADSATRRGQYTYAVTWTRGGVPITRTVHCLIGLGPYAR